MGIFPAHVFLSRKLRRLSEANVLGNEFYAARLAGELVDALKDPAHVERAAPVCMNIFFALAKSDASRDVAHASSYMNKLAGRLTGEQQERNVASILSLYKELGSSNSAGIVERALLGSVWLVGDLANNTRLQVQTAVAVYELCQPESPAVTNYLRLVEKHSRIGLRQQSDRFIDFLANMTHALVRARCPETQEYLFRIDEKGGKVLLRRKTGEESVHGGNVVEFNFWPRDRKDIPPAPAGAPTFQQALLALAV